MFDLHPVFGLLLHQQPFCTGGTVVASVYVMLRQHILRIGPDLKPWEMSEFRQAGFGLSNLIE